MARLHTLHLPNGGFAFIVDQSGDARTGVDQWRLFAQNCGARDILITGDTITTIDPLLPTLEDLDDEPEPEKPWEVREVGIEDAPEPIQRALGAMFGVGPFAALNEPCDPDCPCAATAPDDEPATDNPPSGDDGAPADSATDRFSIVRGGVRYPVPPGMAEAFATAHPPMPNMDAVTPPDQFVPELSERERRVEKILTAGMATVTRLDAQGEPIGEPYMMHTSGITVSPFPLPPTHADVIDAMPPLVFDSSLPPKGPVRVMCGAMNSAQQPCSLELGHEYLHRFMSEA